MSQPHCHNKRRFNTFRLMEQTERARPIVVIPAVGEKLGMLSLDAVTRKYQEQCDSLNQTIFSQSGASGKLTEEDMENIAIAFERRFGKKPIPIEDLING